MFFVCARWMFVVSGGDGGWAFQQIQGDPKIRYASRHHSRGVSNSLSQNAISGSDNNCSWEARVA